MHRVPQAFMVNWNGLPPSSAGLGQAALELLDPNNQARWRDEYAAKKAARGETWP